MSHSRSLPPDLETVFQQPDFFLQKIDPVAGRFEFIESSRGILSSAAFIDGRSELSPDGIIHYVDIQDAMAWHGREKAVAVPDRFIFHMSFCGSTLLARSCDIAGKVFSYKEPQALIDLAGLKAQQHSFYQDREFWHKLVDLTLGKFRRGWTPGEVSLIKPSNWINSILPDLFQCQRGSKAVFLTIDPRKFLIAVLRGGQERITYCCNFLLHLQTAFPEFAPLVAQAAPLGGDPLAGAARLVMVACYLQHQACKGVIEKAQAENYCCLGYDDLMADPENSMALVSKTLDLDLEPHDIKQSIRRNFGHYSKGEEQIYDVNSARKNDRRIEQEYGPVIDQALEWYEGIMS